MDGDDWIEPEMYQEMLEACEEEKAQIAVCAYRKIREGNQQIEQTEFSGRNYVLNRQ